MAARRTHQTQSSKANYNIDGTDHRDIGKAAYRVENRRSAQVASKATIKNPLQSELPENHSRKRKHNSADIEVNQALPSKRSKQSQLLSSNNDKVASIQYWCEAGVWPDEGPTMATGNDPRVELLARPHRSLSRKRSVGGSTLSVLSSEVSSQDRKSNEYESRMFPAKLKTQGYKMHRDSNTPKLRDEDMKMIQLLVNSPSPVPLQSRFDDDKFENTCLKLENQPETKIVRWIGELIFPGFQHPAIAEYNNGQMSELVDELWVQANSITGIKPKPDISVGFDRNEFTDVQLAKLNPYIGTEGSEVSFFAATYSTLLPFISGEVKKSGASVDSADNQNSNSMFFAARGIVSLFQLAGRDIRELDRKVLAFSVSHNNNEVRIHAYYPSIVVGSKITYHRYLVKQYFLQAENGRDKWAAFTFVSNVYKLWVPNHLKQIHMVLDELPLAPSEINNDQSQNTGLSQQLAASSVVTDANELENEVLDPDPLTGDTPETSLVTAVSQAKEKASSTKDKPTPIAKPQKTSKQRQRN